MSYSIDFHFVNVSADPKLALEQSDLVLQAAGLAFLAYCNELYVDENGEADIVFPAIKVQSLEEANVIGKHWLGRVHYYRWQVHFDLGLYVWRDKHTAVVLSMDYSDWERIIKEPSAIEKVAGILCSVADAIGSPFGISRVNSEYVPLETSAFQEALDWVKSGYSEPQVLWVADSVMAHNELLPLVGHRTVIRSLLSYSVVLKLS